MTVPLGCTFFRYLTFLKMFLEIFIQISIAKFGKNIRSIIEMLELQYNAIFGQNLTNTTHSVCSRERTYAIASRLCYHF